MTFLSPVTRSASTSRVELASLEDLRYSPLPSAVVWIGALVRASSKSKISKTGHSLGSGPVGLRQSSMAPSGVERIPPTTWRSSSRIQAGPDRE